MQIVVLTQWLVKMQQAKALKEHVDMACHKEIVSKHTSSHGLMKPSQLQQILKESSPRFRGCMHRCSAGHQKHRAQKRECSRYNKQ